MIIQFYIDLADGRKNNGGARPNSGRPRKIDEDKLHSMMDAVLAPREVWERLGNKVIEEDVAAIKLWNSYRFGVPQTKVEISADPESAPLFQVSIVDASSDK